MNLLKPAKGRRVTIILRSNVLRLCVPLSGLFGRIPRRRASSGFSAASSCAERFVALRKPRDATALMVGRRGA
ncbi:MAG: hypothetical protein LBF62_09540 [Tannerellaceae bacterium]|nr:hypothetical protein [Tannerellaceae bacterium]